MGTAKEPFLVLNSTIFLRVYREWKAIIGPIILLLDDLFLCLLLLWGQCCTEFPPQHQNWQHWGFKWGTIDSPGCDLISPALTLLSPHYLSATLPTCSPFHAVKQSIVWPEPSHTFKSQSRIRSCFSPLAWMCALPLSGFPTLPWNPHQILVLSSSMPFGLSFIVSWVL